MKKFLMFLMLALFCIPWAANAQEELTIYENGTATSTYVPVHGLWADAYLKCEFVVPADELADMTGGTISQMDFYLTTPASAAWTGTFQVFLMEVDAEAISAYYGPSNATVVYTGQLDGTQSIMTVAFTDNYTYSGGNLLVGVYQTAKGNYKSCTFAGETVNNSCVQGYNSSSLESVTVNQRNFIPKTTFTYTPGGGDFCSKPSGVTVTNVNSDNATLNWTMEEGATYSLVMEPLLPMEEGVTSPYLLTGLDPLTTYEVQLFKNCDNGLTSEARTVAFTTTAVAEPVGDAWSDDFEGELGWELINGTCTNAWTVGTAANNGGTHGLYISNDGGTTNAYTITSAAMVYATKLLSFEQGKYQFSFDWLANGEGNYDFLRVALVPASVTLTAGTSLPSGLTTTAVPSGWIAVDGGSKLNLSTAWQGNSVAVTLEGGTYYLVFAWRNDTSSGTTPPAAVDNVSITKINCDQDVTNLTVSNITTTSANLTWSGGEATQWQVAYSTNASFEDATEVTVSDSAYNMAGLQSANTYYVKVRAYCGGEDFGAWSEVINFPTACEAFTDYPFTENFDSYTVASSYTAPSTRLLPICWYGINTTTYSSYQPFPTMFYNSSTNYANSTPNCLKLYSYYSSYGSYDPQPQYAVLPAMENLNGKMLTLNVRGYNASSTFKVGMMTDPMDASTFVEIAEQALTTSYQEFSYILNGEGNYVAIMIDAATSDRTSNGAYIDDILVGDAPTCAKPQGLAVSEVTNHTATLTWVDSVASAWQISLVQGQEETIIDVEENPYTLRDLDASTAYTVMVRANCGNDGVSYWSTAKSFTTLIACPAPTSLTASNLTGHAATLSWTENGSATEWVVRYALSGDTAYTEVNVYDTTVVTITSLEPSTNYTSNVKAVCGGIDGESAWSSARTFTTTEACPAPTNFVCTGVTATTATLSWFEGEATEWEIMLFQDGQQVNGYVVTEVPYTIEDLTPETVYTARVRAMCDTNWSSTISFEPTAKIVIGSGTNTLAYLPTQTYYNYSLTQQIYTVEELGEAGVIESVDFYSTATNRTRTLDVYVVSTDKAEFESTTDWISVTESDKVFSGSVTFAQNAWTTITFNDPFIYDGTQNVAIIVDDNTGSYLSGSNFRVFTASSNQAIYYYNDGNNYDPTGTPDAASGRSTSKNQIRILKSEMSDCMRPSGLAASEVDAHSAVLSWTENGTAESWWIEYYAVDQNSPAYDGGMIEDVTENPYTLTGLSPETTYGVRVISSCAVEEGDPMNDMWSNTIEFTTDIACPAPTDLTYSLLADGVNVGWNGTSDSYNVQYGLDNPAFKVSTDFEDQAIPQICENDTAYPWTIEAGNGGYYIKSGNAGVSASTSAISVTMEYPEDGIVAFDAECRGEGTSTYWDHCDFYIDDTRELYAGANISGWNHYEFEVPAGTHTFTWSYTKDGSMDPSGDYFAIDNVVMRALPNIEWNDPVTVTGNNVDITLPEAGEYYVQVQGDCGDEDGLSSWSEPMIVNFTPSNCLISLNQANNYTWTETFEGYTNVMNPRWTGAAVPCWTLVEQYTGAAMNQIGDQIDTLPQIYRAFNTTEDGDYTLRIHFNSLIAMPELAEDIDLANVRLSLNVRQPYWRYKLQIGVMTDINDPESFVPVAVVNNTTKNMTHYECGFWSVKDLVGAGRHIAFKNIGNAEHDPYCTNYLDDITLTYVDANECVVTDLPYTEDFEDYTAGEEPDCWVLVSEDAALESNTRPMVYAGFNTTEEGANTLRMRNRCVYAMPEINPSMPVNILNLTMTFNLRQPNALYRLQVGLVNDEGEFTPVKTLKCNSTSMEPKTVEFVNYTGGRIAFRNTLVPGTGMATDYLDYSYNYIDDINIVSDQIHFDQGNRNGASDEDAMNADLDNIAVYPNPTTGNLYIDAVGIQKVECYNQMGQLVRVYDNVVNSIDLNNLSEGVYMLRITVPQGVTMRKVVKR